MDKVVVSNTKGVNATAITLLLGAAITTNTGASEVENLSFWLLPASAQIPVQGADVDGEKPVTNLMPVTQDESIVFAPEVISRAKEILGISNQHLASIFGISRQHLNNIVNDPNIAIKDSNQLRVVRVDEALSAIRSVTEQKLGASTLTMRIDNVRLLDILLADEINLDQVKRFAVHIDSRISSQESDSSLPEVIASQQEHLDTPDAV